MSVAAWQKEALLSCLDLLDIQLVLNCENTVVKRAYIKNFFYYGINFFCLRSQWTRSVPLAIQSDKILTFQSEYQGIWQHFPPTVLEALNDQFDVVIKFGMNLLYVPETLKIKMGILSFHHGDPEKYRGRPAGFYEILKGENCVGIIVQRLSNQLDGGAIYEKAFSKIWHHSYRKTAFNFYKNSVPLLRKALYKAVRGQIEANHAQGKRFTLPSNRVALRFLFTLLIRKSERLWYGAFYKKQWNIALLKSDQSWVLLKVPHQIHLKNALVPTIDAAYVFYADPFFSVDGSKLYVEAIRRETRQGDIVVLNQEQGTVEEVLLTGRHFSYPLALREGDEEYLFPEMANSMAQHFIHFGTENIALYQIVKGLEKDRLVDATYFFYEGWHYIFASRVHEFSDTLLLFLSRERLGPYQEHPCNPIVIDPTCARMGGAIHVENGRLYRIGQNNAFHYGEQLWICEIQMLNPMIYQEQKIKMLIMEGNIRGPHTLNIHANYLTIDFYRDTFSWNVGFQRLLNLIKKQKT